MLIFEEISGVDIEVCYAFQELPFFFSLSQFPLFIKPHQMHFYYTEALLATLTLYFIMLKNGQIYFKNLAV